MALRYHSIARVESRSTTKPRSYITPTLKADCAEPRWAARNSQPAPACWSFGDADALHQAARQFLHGGNLVGVRLGPAARRSASRSSRPAPPARLSGRVACRRGQCRRWSVRAAAGRSGIAIEATGASAGGAGVAAWAATSLAFAALLIRGGGAVSGGRVTQAPVAAAAMTSSATPAISAGRFATDGAARCLGQSSLPIILRP